MTSDFTEPRGRWKRRRGKATHDNQIISSQIILTPQNTPPFIGPFCGTTRVSQYQKGKTNLDFTEARDSEWQWHQLGHMQVCISLQRDNHNNTPPLSFLQAGCPSCRPTNSVKALKGWALKKAPSEIIILIQHTVTVHSSVIDTERYFFVDVVLCNCSNSRIWLFIYVTLTFLFSPVTVSFYFSSMAKLRFVNCCTNKRIWMRKPLQMKIS